MFADLVHRGAPSETAACIPTSQQPKRRWEWMPRCNLSHQYVSPPLHMGHLEAGVQHRQLCPASIRNDSGHVDSDTAQCTEHSTAPQEHMSYVTAHKLPGLCTADMPALSRVSSRTARAELHTSRASVGHVDPVPVVSTGQRNNLSRSRPTPRNHHLLVARAKSRPSMRRASTREGHSCTTWCHMCADPLPCLPGPRPDTNPQTRTQGTSRSMQSTAAGSSTTTLA